MWTFCIFNKKIETKQQLNTEACHYIAMFHSLRLTAHRKQVNFIKIQHISANLSKKSFSM